MNKTHASPGRSLALAAVLCALLFVTLFIASAIQPAFAHARDVETFPANAQSFNGSLKLRLSKNNMSVDTSNDRNWLKDGKWYKAEKTVKDVGGAKLLLIKRWSANTRWRCYNPFKLTFRDAGEIDGKKLKVEVAITEVKIDQVRKAGCKSGLGAGGYGWHSEYLQLAKIYDNDFWVGTDGPEGSGDVYTYSGGLHINYSVKVMWQDGSQAGQTVDLPFYQAVTDIDQTYSWPVLNKKGKEVTATFKEGWVPASGFSSYKVYNGYQLSGDAPWWPYRDESDVAGCTDGGFWANANDLADNDWDIRRGSVFALTGNGSFAGRFYESSCATQIAVYSGYSSAASPSKTAVDWVKPGDTIDWTINQEMGTLGKNCISSYQEIHFWDCIDTSKQQLVGYNLTNGSADEGGDGYNANGHGWVDGDSDPTKSWVNWMFYGDWVGNLGHYNGQNLALHIQTKVNDDATGTISNTGTVSHIANSTGMNTNSKEVHILAPVRYYADGELVYTDWVKWTDAYAIDSAATKAAKKAGCLKLTDWYTDPDLTDRYVSAKPSEQGLNLYAKNVVTLSYAATTDSWFNKHKNSSFFTDEPLTNKLKNRVTGLTENGSSIFPSGTKQYYYGDIVTVKKGLDLYYKNAILGGNEIRKLTCSDGCYAYQDGSGDLLKEIRLTCNSTAYLKWTSGSYDGVYAAG